MSSLAIKEAIVAKLTEPVLAGLMPGGIFYDVASGPATQFVIVGILADTLTYMHGGIAFEEYVVLVKAVDKTLSQGNASAAAARIDALMQDEFGTLVIDGYGHDHTHKVAVVDEVEIDDVNPEIRWQHRGGHYEVVVIPTLTLAKERT